MHSNQVQCAAGDTNSIGGGGSEPPLAPSLAASAGSALQAPEVMVKRADGSGSTVPLCIYPPGSDLSGFIVLDPSTGEWVSGSGYTINRSSLNRLQRDDPQPQDDDPGVGSPPDPGFYQIVRDGVHVVGLSNLNSGSVSNTITISFEAGNAIGTLLEVNLLVDGLPCCGADALAGPPFYPGAMPLDTAFLENGDHTVQVVGGWLNLDPADPNNYMIHRWSDPLTITVSNVIYYPDWCDQVGELGFSAYYAKTTCTNADWQIDIYDVNTNFVQRLTGHTDDGTIEAYWNLMDTNGVTRTNLDTDPEFSSILTVADPTTKALPKKKTSVSYPTQGQWTIAYQDTFSYMVNSNLYYNAIYQFGGIAAPNGGAHTYFPTPGHPEYGQTFPIRYMNTNQPINWTWIGLDNAALMNLLTNRASRNFYYNGHGGAESIPIMVTAANIEKALRNHYYRFVFLDACSTANGSLPSAFGIGFNAPKGLSFFQADGTRPRAFMGYPQDVQYAWQGDFRDPLTGIHYGDQVAEEVTEFLTNFEFYWYFDHDLLTSVYYAYRDTPSLPSGWQNGASLKIFGYDGLGIGAYNAKTDWSQ